MSGYREQFSIYSSIIECVSNRTAYLELRAAEMGRYWRRHKGVSFIVSLRTMTYRMSQQMRDLELTPWIRVLLERLTSGSQEIPRILRNLGFIMASTNARHLTLSWDRSINSIPAHPIYWRTILVISFHLNLGLPSGLFTSYLPTIPLYATLLSSTHSICISFFIVWTPD